MVQKCTLLFRKNDECTPEQEMRLHAQKTPLPNYLVHAPSARAFWGPRMSVTKEKERPRAPLREDPQHHACTDDSSELRDAERLDEEIA